LLAWVGYEVTQALLNDRDLDQAIAEADRLDPGWRFEDLEAARPPLPDAENSALQVLAAAGQLPKPWPPTTFGGPKLPEWTTSLAPPVRLEDKQTQTLRAELSRVAPALTTARQVADKPRGRYTVVWMTDGVGTLMPHLQEARTVANVLYLDAVLRAQDDDIEGALVSCRAALNVGRSVGDEPAAISQLVRLSCLRVALRGLERTLAQGQAPAPALEALQQLLQDEAEQPLQLIMTRSERAAIHQHLEVVRAGQLNRAAYGLRSSRLGSSVDNLVDRAKAMTSHALYLKFLTKLVEISKLPPEQQHAQLQQLELPKMELPTLLSALMRADEPRKLAVVWHTAQAQLRCALAALAIERYRLEQQRWPDKLEELVPRYLRVVPNDPFDGKPLRLRRTKDGLVTYSVGPDFQDNGGAMDLLNPQAPGTDVGFRLWDVGRRHQPAHP
jgi:hypothetical protein